MAWISKITTKVSTKPRVTVSAKESKGFFKMRVEAKPVARYLGTARPFWKLT
jgi:hypothetical protein